MPHETAERVHAESAVAWRTWLEANHERPNGVWLVSWKTATGRPRMTYEESVVEALAFGWVDSTARTLDDERAMLWFAPRRRGSGWARPNKQRIERLEREGRLAPAGRAAVERAKADGSWTLLDAVEDLIVPDDLAAAFEEQPGAAEQWEAFPRSARRAILEWIVQARTPETRRRRITEAADKASRGERANQWQPRPKPG
jgi:uncharacterized protein YdeI (YjbR/CyaY-like superfamily)